MKQRVPLSSKELDRPVIDFILPVTTVLRASETIREALSSLQGRKIDQKIFYFYVLDHEGRLVGVTSTRNLLLASLDEKISKVMDPTVDALCAKQKMSEALESLEKLSLLALPVIDGEQRLLGTIDVQHYIEQPLGKVSSEARRDIFQFIGLSIEEGKLGTPWKGFKARMPWIVCNMVSGLCCAMISKAFEDVLAKAIILAMFIPLLLTLSESISMQAMTQSLSILRSPRLIIKMIKRRLVLEAKTVFFLASLSAIAIGLLSCLWGGGWTIVLVIGISLYLSIMVSAMIGSIMPMALKFFKKDPKIAAGPVVLMIVDVIAMMFYLTFAYRLLPLGI